MNTTHSGRGGAVRLAAVISTYVLLSHAASALAAFGVNSPNSLWTPVFPSASNDYFSDQQTGQGQSDLVGDATHPHLFWHFEPGSTSSTDGTMYFRARIAGKDKTVNWPFDNVVMIGMDFAAPAYGKMDIFLLCNAGAQAKISVNGAGSGANTSPNSTTVGNAIGNTYLLTASNYNFSYLSPTIDDTTPSPILDLDGNLATDAYVSFAIPFSDVVVAAQAPYVGNDGGAGLTNVSDTTPIRFGVGTSTQVNAFNQDVGGVNRTGMGTLWSDFATPPVSTGGINAIPEPATVGAICAVSLLALNRRQRPKHCSASRS